MMGSFSSQKDLQITVERPDVAKNSRVTEESDILSPKPSDWSRRGSEDMLDCVPETDNSVLMDDLMGLPSMSCKTRFGLKSDQGMTTSSAGSMTRQSPLLTPQTNQIDLFLIGKGTYPEHEDIPQVLKKADMIHKNAVASILAECDSLISVRNPFVMLLTYTLQKLCSHWNICTPCVWFTDNLIISRLPPIEASSTHMHTPVVARMEEYMGFALLNEFLYEGLHLILEVGLINSTDDLCGPVVSGTSILEEDEPQQSGSDPFEPMHNQQRREKCSAAQLLIGGLLESILFELIIGIPPWIPPFNAEHPWVIYWSSEFMTL
ncbi:hypothetical protein C5167_037239 [Papaver somniferum]|uniref:Uncharacterized protein n=1 Tax=Papaver somniferum TaxID=3469 RepID=A0A4Y7I9W4_PAPSO|nr:hypothetical protein C5167_037239 [Papaver somniferum]